MSEEENMEDEESFEVELLEFSLGNEEVDELIGKLNSLKENKESFVFEIDDTNELLIHHDENTQEEVNE